jgi:adenine-specific DNA-methyltransferase
MNPLQGNARELRKTQTDAERRLWQFLRNRSLAGCKFRRQHPVGPCICDFVCIDRQVVIEVDGGHHADQVEKDEARTAYLESKGYTVMRFWNHEVLRETEAVLERILNMISSDSPHPVPLPKGARERCQ